MFLACSRTLDFASTMEDGPAVVDLKRTRGTLLDAVRCIILWGEGEKEEKEKDGEWSSYERERESERPGVRWRMYKHESEKTQWRWKPEN